MEKQEIYAELVIVQDKLVRLLKELGAAEELVRSPLTAALEEANIQATLAKIACICNK